MPEDKNKHLRSEEDSQLFRQSIGDVKKLHSDRQSLVHEKPKPKPVRKSFEVAVDTQNIFQLSENIQSNDNLFFARDGVQHKTIKRLKRGDIFIDERLDLHGLIAQEAAHVLCDFLASQVAQKHRCILVIHGKGAGSVNQLPVLKNLAFNFLKDEPSVLAISSAQQRDGGTGALYALLKRRG